jgi:hypothetical protein
VADEDNSADGLEVILPAASVSFDPEALAAIAAQADGGDLTLHLDDVSVTELTEAQRGAVQDLEIEVTLDARLSSGGERISDFRGGSATVRVPYALRGGQVPAGLTVWYIADDGTRTQVPATYDGENVVFTVAHFSTYVVAYDAARAASCPRDGGCPLSAFTDLDVNAWYHDGVHFCLENGIMQGFDDGLFYPDLATTRAQIVTMLWNIEGKPVVDRELNFDDVADTDWFAAPIRWAVDKGIVEGHGDGTFAPNDPVTREQLAKIIFGYARFKGVNTLAAVDLNKYPDADRVSEWAVSYMQWAVGSGLITGSDENGVAYLLPQGNASRAQVATIVCRYLTTNTPAAE